ncbi:MAG TPA: histidine phosphatase family protein [Anaeromyxobacteraceae bacterium]
MKPVRVYLVRHGKAEKQAAHGDAARRLTPEGRARFTAFAEQLAPRLEIARVVSSPFARARETAQILAAATGARLEESGELASGTSSGRELLALARRGGDGVALVGHNPELEEAIALAAGAEQKVRPGTIAAIDLLDRGEALAWIEAPAKE